MWTKVNAQMTDIDDIIGQIDYIYKMQNEEIIVEIKEETRNVVERKYFLDQLSVLLDEKP